MMTNSAILLLSISVFATTITTSQEIHSKIYPLTIGDTVSDIEFTSVNNYPTKPVRLSDFKDKLVILDFWATWCSPCVAALPKMNKLQKEFDKEIQIIAVTSEKDKAVQSFFNKYKAAESISSLIIVAGDSICPKYFPRKSIPHCVWIDKGGIVKAITSGEYVKSENIAFMLSGSSVKWDIKDLVMNYDYSPLFYSSSTAGNLKGYYNGITRFIDGATAGEKMERDSINKTIRYNQYNLPLLSLYAFSFDRLSVLDNPKRCHLNVGDISKFIYNNHDYWDQWEKENSYSYEAYFKEDICDYKDYKSMMKTIRMKMKADIDFNFGLTTQVVKKKVKCLVLKIVNTSLVPVSKGELPRYGLTKVNGNYGYQQKNKQLYDLVFAMNHDYWMKDIPLVIDETNYSDPMDMEFILGSDPQNIEIWKKELNKYGLDLIQEERNIDILDISDAK